jgi:hypothetical protein
MYYKLIIKRFISNKSKKLLNKNLLQKNNIISKKVIKRYYIKSNYIFGKDKISEIVKIGNNLIPLSKELYEIGRTKLIKIYDNTITKNNVSKEIKIQNKLLNSQFKKNIIMFEQKMVAYDHRGIVKGIKINKDESIDLTYFETITNKSIHQINLNLSKEELVFLPPKDYIIPTISMPDNKPVSLENFNMNYKGIIKTPVINNKILKLEEKNVIKIPNGLGKELQERTEGFMEIIG